MNSFIGKIVGFLFIVMTLVFVLKDPSESQNTIPQNLTSTSYDTFIDNLKAGHIEEVSFNKDIINYRIGDNDWKKTIIIKELGDKDLLNDLLKQDVKFSETPTKPNNVFVSLLLNMIPFVIVLLGINWVMNRQQNKMMNIGQKKPESSKPLHSQENPIRFVDVAGNDEAKKDVEELVDYLKNPQKYQEIGAKLPHGVLLQGSPGNGKTLLAKAIAGEAGVPFFSVSGSEFVEKFVGVGASRVRELFREAKANAPCIIFIDEIDAMGKTRSMSGNGGNDEREQTLNQMLVEMDGFGSFDSVIVMAATNRVDMLDPALRRPGRFDRTVSMNLPDVKGREAILSVHLKKLKKVSQDVNLSVIARGTSGFSGADLANLVNEAAISAIRHGKTVVDKLSFEDAKDRIIMGNARTGLVLKEKEKSLTAYHEAGHAIVGEYHRKLGFHDPVYKVSVIPRDRALGVTVYLPEEDKRSLNYGEAIAHIQTLLAGRIAEKLITNDNEVSAGASNDIERATQVATNMVTKWGLSKVGSGIRHLGKLEQTGESSFVSPKMSEEIDNEIQKILDECYKDSFAIMIKHQDVLEKMHDALMVKETIDNEEVEKLMKGESICDYDNYEDSYKKENRNLDNTISTLFEKEDVDYINKKVAEIH